MRTKQPHKPRRFITTFRVIILGIILLSAGVAGPALLQIHRDQTIARGAKENIVKNTTIAIFAKWEKSGEVSKEDYSELSGKGQLKLLLNDSSWGENKQIAEKMLTEAPTYGVEPEF